MPLVLYVIGAIALIIAIIVGFIQGTFWGFIVSVSGGISLLLIFFALAKILDNQDRILFKIASQYEIYKKYFKQPKVICPNCHNEHESDYSSCPHCGYRY